MPEDKQVGPTANQSELSLEQKDGGTEDHIHFCSMFVSVYVMKILGNLLFSPRRAKSFKNDTA